MVQRACRHRGGRLRTLACGGQRRALVLAAHGARRWYEATRDDPAPSRAWTGSPQAASPSSALRLVPLLTKSQLQVGQLSSPASVTLTPWRAIRSQSASASASAPIPQHSVSRPQADNDSRIRALPEYAAENNNGACADGETGDPANNWPCMNDLACKGTSFNGHGRGMCQWGSQRHAVDGKSYTWILNHYYNNNGNPAGAREAFITSL